MTLITKHIFKRFMGSFVMVLSAILIVYLCVDFLQKADRLIRFNANIVQVVLFFIYSIPEMASWSLPVAALISVLLALGSLSRYNEIIAMRAGGVSLAAIMAPVLAGGFFISVVGFINNEYIVPVYTARAGYIRNIEIEKKQQRVMFQQRRLWLRGPDNSIVNIDFIPPRRTEMLGLNIYKLNPDYSVRERIKAGSLRWENGAWRLRDSRKFVPEGDRVRTLPADGEVFNLVDGPEDLEMIVKSSGEMNIVELWDYVKRLKASGYKATEYEVDLQTKLAFPLSSLLMVMIAAPLSLVKVRSGGGRGFVVAILIAFLYWALLSIGTSLGHTGVLPPFAAAWLANLCFAAASLSVLFRMQKLG